MAYLARLAALLVRRGNRVGYRAALSGFLQNIYGRVKRAGRCKRHHYYGHWYPGAHGSSLA
jgi:hypothetical protein